MTLHACLLAICNICRCLQSSSTQPSGWQTRRCCTARRSARRSSAPWTCPRWLAARRGPGGAMWWSRPQHLDQQAQRERTAGAAAAGRCSASCCYSCTSLPVSAPAGCPVTTPSQLLAHAAHWLGHSHEARQCLRRASKRPCHSPCLPCPHCLAHRGEENISAIVAPIFTGFRLDSLGAPEEAAQRFIDNTFAPAGSGKEGTLIAATSWWVAALGRSVGHAEATRDTESDCKCSLWCHAAARQVAACALLTQASSGS